MTQFPEAFSELAKWVKPLCRYGKIEDFIFCDNNSFSSKLNRFRFYLFTKEYQYLISAYLPEGQKDGYLGCIVKTRKPRAGESWNRGNDLADGNYSEETFRNIVNDILAYELVKVAKPQKQLVDK